MSEINNKVPLDQKSADFREAYTPYCHNGDGSGTSNSTKFYYSETKPSHRWDLMEQNIEVERGHIDQTDGVCVCVCMDEKSRTIHSTFASIPCMLRFGFTLYADSRHRHPVIVQKWF